MTDAWAGLADSFVDGAYATVKGRVRTYVLHHQLLDHLPPPPATILDVGGGAGNQSFPLAKLGYDLTLVDPSAAMLEKARSRQDGLNVTLVHGEATAVDGQFDVVLCHGVLGYLDDPEPLVGQLCERVASGGVVSIMTANADAMVVRPALEQRWDDARAAFDDRREIGVLGVPGRADTVDELTALLESHGVARETWYGVWLFVDWLEFAGAEPDKRQLERIAEVELEASRRDPYRGVSRVFHLVGRKR